MMTQVFPIHSPASQKPPCKRSNAAVATGERRSSHMNHPHAVCSVCSRELEVFYGFAAGTKVRVIGVPALHPRFGNEGTVERQLVAGSVVVRFSTSATAGFATVAVDALEVVS